MNLQQWTGIAGIGALIAAATAGWAYVRTLTNWIRDLVVCRAVIAEDAADAVLSLCWQRGRRSPFGLRAYGGTHSWVQPAKRVQMIGYESISSDPVLFWFGRAPVVIARSDNRDSSNLGAGTNHQRSVSVFFIRGTLEIDQLVTDSVRHYNAVKQGTNGQAKRRRFHVQRMGGSRHDISSREAGNAGVPVPSSPHDKAAEIAEHIVQKTMRLLEWRHEDLVAVTPDRSPFHGYVFPQSIMSAMSEMKMWIDNEAWFRAKSVPWRRGWLLHGPPGTGKSTLVRAMAMHFDLPVFTFDLSTHDNESFTAAWSQVSSNAPCVALIEDIDGVFDGRTNVAVTNKNRDNLTFDCLLNCISGVGNSDGVFLIVTTNHPERLDPALGVVEGGRSSRPGRIDRIIELTFMQEPERRALANHILSDFDGEIGNAVSRGEGMTAAQFQDHCAQIALRAFWEKNK